MNSLQHSIQIKISKSMFYSQTAEAYFHPNIVLNYAMRLYPQRRKPIHAAMCRFTSILPTNASVIDLGCGTGKDVAWFRSKGIHALGLDYSKEMIKIARKCVGNYFFKCDIRKLKNIQQGPFDGVFSLAALQHIHRTDILSVFDQIRSLLRPNGIFCLITKEGEGEHWDTRLKNSLRATTLFSRLELYSGLHQKGFTILRSESFSLEREEKVDNWLSIHSIVLDNKQKIFWANKCIHSDPKSLAAFGPGDA